MDFIFEKTKTIANKDNLVILLQKVRSLGSCCVTYYIDLCKEYGLHLHKNIYIENEDEIRKKLYRYIIKKLFCNFYFKFKNYENEELEETNKMVKSLKVLIKKNIKFVYSHIKYLPNEQNMFLLLLY